MPWPNTRNATQSGAGQAGADEGRGRKHLLVVEDEPALREMLVDNFRIGGYRVEAAGRVDEALARIAAAMPSLVLLDWMLPDASGIDLLRRLRRDRETRTLPVIMLTARGEEVDRIRGLDIGADDYLSKPFSLRELEARIKAVLRRTGAGEHEPVIKAGALAMDCERHQVTAHGVEIKLGPTEFRLLHVLISHPERVFSRVQLLDSAWGHDVYVEERTVDVHVRRLRKRLEPSGTDGYIETVRGVGYRLVLTPPSVAAQ